MKMTKTHLVNEHYKVSREMLYSLVSLDEKGKMYGMVARVLRSTGFQNYKFMDDGLNIRMGCYRFNKRDSAKIRKWALSI